MNDNLTNALIDLINSVVQAKDFILSEVPQVIDQLLLWKMIASIPTFIFVLVLLSSGFWIKPIIRSVHPNDNTEVVGWSVTMFILGWLTGIGILINGNAIDWLQILIAPKIYLIEYAASLAN